MGFSSLLDNKISKLIIQWGKTASSGNLVLPISFSNTNYICSVAPWGGGFSACLSTTYAVNTSTVSWHPWGFGGTVYVNGVHLIVIGT